ncbi:MAG: hypothetical protein PHX61_08670 [Alphaproteobacteria bacterium]|nr:hypothetical protein [Alphaproteobacteria bacterium]OIN86743.1 MAG: hypothetical protein AUJ12_03760 [Alphaproteobacteria bacterium CG1_02_46_17]
MVIRNLLSEQEGSLSEKFSNVCSVASLVSKKLVANVMRKFSKASQQHGHIVDRLAMEDAMSGFPCDYDYK